MSGNIRTTASLLASFYAASRITDPARGAMPMTASSAAGMLLHISPGPKMAIELARRMPPDPIWKLAISQLETLLENERRDTEPPIAAAGGSR